MEEGVTLNKDSQGQKSQEWPASTSIFCSLLWRREGKHIYTLMSNHINEVTLVQVE